MNILHTWGINKLPWRAITIGQELKRTETIVHGVHDIFKTLICEITTYINLLKQPWKSSLNLMNKFLALLLQKILTPVKTSHRRQRGEGIVQNKTKLDFISFTALLKIHIPNLGNHLACSTQGSSPDSQHLSPPSQQKHFTSSLRPVKQEKKIKHSNCLHSYIFPSPLMKLRSTLMREAKETSPYLRNKNQLWLAGRVALVF